MGGMACSLLFLIYIIGLAAAGDAINAKLTEEKLEWLMEETVVL
jgi:hypothetical protein